MAAPAVIEMVKINNGGRPVAAQERTAVNLLRATEPGRLLSHAVDSSRPGQFDIFRSGQPLTAPMPTTTTSLVLAHLRYTGHSDLQFQGFRRAKVACARSLSPPSFSLSQTETRLQEQSPIQVKAMSEIHGLKRVLFVGQEPETVDFSDPALPPGFDAAKIHAGISVSMQQMEAHGWRADLCLLKPDETAPITLERQLTTSTYDCVVIGGGIRIPPKSLLLFEALVNTAHKCAPNASIAFNTRPEDTAEAAARWLKGK